MPNVPSIRRDSAWSRLHEMLDAEGVGGLKTMLPYLMPVVDFLKVLAEHTIVLSECAVGATGTFWSVTVPADETWEMIALETYVSTGTFTVTQTSVRNPAGTVMDLAEFTATTKRNDVYSQPIHLGPSWKIGANVNSFTGAGTLRGTVLIRKYKLGS